MGAQDSLLEEILIKKHSFSLLWFMFSGSLCFYNVIQLEFVCLFLGHDFCSEGHKCLENSFCRNVEGKAVCSCRDGFQALRDDSVYCEGKFLLNMVTSATKISLEYCMKYN